MCMARDLAKFLRLNVVGLVCLCGWIVIFIHGFIMDIPSNKIHFFGLEISQLIIDSVVTHRAISIAGVLLVIVAIFVPNQKVGRFLIVLSALLYLLIFGWLPIVSIREVGFLDAYWLHISSAWKHGYWFVFMLRDIFLPLLFIGVVVATLVDCVKPGKAP